MDKINEYINQLREDYSRETLDEKQVDSNPIKQFEKWFTEAVDSKVNEPHAMTLATANKEGFPSARIVLLRNFEENGFVFYSNYTSRKGEETRAAATATAENSKVSTIEGISLWC